MGNRFEGLVRGSPLSDNPRYEPGADPGTEQVGTGITTTMSHNEAACHHDPMGELKIFAGSSSQSFAQAICNHIGIPLAQSETITFSDGNVFVRILENVRGRDVFIVQGTERPVNDNCMELLFWIDAFKRASATQVTAVIPYFSYAKGDKKDEPRVSIRARAFADCLEAVGADRILTMDLHSPQIQGFFKIPVDHLLAMPVLVNYYRQKQVQKLVIAAPDAGYSKQAWKFAKAMEAEVAFGNKIRTGHDEEAKILDVIGDELAGKSVLIVDDFTISGGTLIEMARACEDAGAAQVFACVSHGVFNESAAHKLENSPIQEIVITDTIDHNGAAGGERVLPRNCHVVSVAKLFAQAILSIHRQESVSRLFEHDWKTDA